MRVLFIYEYTFRTVMSIHRIGTSVPYDSNIYLVKGRSAVLIDTGTGLDSQSVISQVWELLGGVRLSAVLLTHCHADHVGGLRDILQEFGCPAYISEAEMYVIAEADQEVSFALELGVDLQPVPCKKLLPTDVFDLGDHVLEVIPTPGHTAGSVCFRDRVTGALFSGDTVFAQGYGRTDLLTGNFRSICKSLDLLRNVNIGTLYPGHGPTAADGKKAVNEAIAMTEVSY